MNNDLTQAELNAVITYDGDTGVMYNRVQRSGSAKKGAVAGALDKSKGYWMIGLNGKHYNRSRLAWLYTYGYFPEHFIDHRNRIRTDDRIANLREVTQQCNLRNAGVYANSKTRVTGVNPESQNPDIFKAVIEVNGKAYYIGQSKDFVDACALRFAAEQCLDWPDCNTHSSAGQAVQDYIKEAR